MSECILQAIFTIPSAFPHLLEDPQVMHHIGQLGVARRLTPFDDIG